LIALVTLGAILFALLLICIIMTCCRKKPRKTRVATGMSFLPQRVANRGTMGPQSHDSRHQLGRQQVRNQHAPSLRPQKEETERRPQEDIRATHRRRKRRVKLRRPEGQVSDGDDSAGQVPPSTAHVSTQQLHNFRRKKTVSTGDR
jgi:hypothetical protein